ncbi:sugar transporter [Hyaloscypha variabilis F]|uniref:Sugar transporter n=1 Tax=Hyaloscypha variabilis (strain UAMH 11265 / GT02V1 / F) TaxID=1149755 RepID=A0A2J6S1B6_HYAVF|nr:sugar transporter [Hyaloscypha variabilis F]
MSSADHIARLNHLIDASNEGVEAEHRMPLRDALRLYPKAIGWSILLSLTIVMEGYDLTIINGFYAFPEFKKAYGERVGDNDYQITTAWQSGLTNGAVVGEILGLLFNGHLTERFGYRRTLIFALLALISFIFLAVFAFNIGMLMASEVLCGLSWGVFQTLSTTYAAEIMPVALRAYLTSNVNLCWLIGQIIGTGVLRGLIDLQSKWSYRIPFSLQWMWALPILIGVLLAPESPWWLVRHGKYDKARASLLRLTRRGHHYDAEDAIMLMKRTNEVEEYLSAGVGYLDCFKGVNLRRTEIACMVWMIQTLCGSPMTGYATYFYVQAGFDPERAFDLSLGMYGMAIVGGMISWLLLPSVGRRTLYLWGTGLMCLILVAGGIVGTQHDSTWVSWTLGSVVILFTFVYDTTVGPVCYSLVAELPSTRLRVKTVVLARVAYNLAGIISNVLMPKMLNPTAWNWRGKTCFLWAGTCFCCYIWCYFRLPEPKGLTYLELDLLFEKKVSARKFRRITNVLSEAGYFDILVVNKEFQDFRGVPSYR